MGFVSMSRPDKRQASPQWFELCRRAVPKERRRQLDPTNSDGPTSERCWAKSSNATYRKRQTVFFTQSVVLVRTFGVLSTVSISGFHVTVKVHAIYSPHAACGRKCNKQNFKNRRIAIYWESDQRRSTVEPTSVVSPKIAIPSSVDASTAANSRAVCNEPDVCMMT